MRLVEMAGLRRHPGVMSMVTAAGVNSGLADRLATQLQRRAALSTVEHPFLSPGDEELSPEGIALGSVLYMNGDAGLTVRLPKARFAEHVYLAGAPGTGKTYIAKHICVQLHEAGIPFWWFDTQGDVYEHLASALGAGQVLYLPISRLKRNPLEPLPGEHIDHTVARLLDVLREALYLRDGAQNLLGRALVGELGERGVFQGSENYPSMLDIGERISTRMKFRVTSRQAQFHETLVNRFQAIEDQLSYCYDCSKGFPVAELARRSIVFGLHGIGTEMQELVLKELLAALSAYMTLQPSHGELRIELVLDEAHRFASREKVSRYDLGEILLFRLAREMRKCGIGMILADQAPSQLAPQMLAVCNTRLVSRLLNGSCMQVIAASMPIGPEERQYLSMVPMRRAILQSAQYPRPFVIEVPELRFPEADATALRRTNEAQLYAMLWKARSRLTGPVKVESIDEPDAPAALSPGEPGLSKELLDYLAAIPERPFEPATVRDRRLEIGNWKGNAMRDELAGNGWIVIHRVPTGRKGAYALCEFTPKAWQLLEELKVNTKPPAGKGGFLHSYYQAQLCRWAHEHGLRAEIEHGHPGKAVDVMVEREGRRLAIEVALNPRH
jgi:hypothetical protein